MTGILIAVFLRGLSGALNQDHTQWLRRHTGSTRDLSGKKVFSAMESYSDFFSTSCF